MENTKDWIKLDNAALIYPATLNRKLAAMFRLSVTLTENIDTVVLKEALKNIMKRFPTFGYTLKQGFFWCYFNKINKLPAIDNDAQNPMIRNNFDGNFLFRIRVYKNRLAVEYFHALTDGTGALTFIMSLTGEYLRIKYGIKIKYSNLILNPNDQPTKEEMADSFLKYARKASNFEHEKRAYHIKGKKEKANIINIITGKIDINEVKKLAKKYNATITEFLASMILFSIRQMAKTKKQIKVSIPINLRNIYETNTLRNFSSYINVGIDGAKDYTLNEIIKEVKSQLQIMKEEKRINAKISANVNLMKNQLIRRIPMFIKKPLMSIIEYIVGDGYISTTLSNLGLVDIPTSMQKYISDMNFILGKSRGKSGSVTAIGCKSNIYITFSRKIKESEFERIFFTNLANMGLDIEIESNR